MPPVMHRQGWIEVIAGPMFSGKSEELIRRVRRALIARQSVLVFKPRLDNRYHESHVVSHDGKQVAAIPVESAAEMEAHLDPLPQVVAVDEVQFLDRGLLSLVERLAGPGGCGVILAGAGPGLPGGALWPHAGASGPGGVRGEAFRHLPEVRGPRPPAPSAW